MTFLIVLWHYNPLPAKVLVGTVTFLRDKFCLFEGRTQRNGVSSGKFWRLFREELLQPNLDLLQDLVQRGADFGRDDDFHGHFGLQMVSQ